MTTPAPTRRPRRVRPRSVAVGVCALVWVACSVAVVWLAGASQAAEDRRHTEYADAGPAQDDLETWLILPLYLGAGALVAGVGLLAADARRGRTAAPVGQARGGV